MILTSGEKMGVGECGLFRGLSADDRPDYEQKLLWLCEHINDDKDWLYKELYDFPSIQFGMEQAFLSLEAKQMFDLFPSDFSRGRDKISINGLIWMGDESFMKEQITNKLEAGFTTLKMKIGAIDFKTELQILKSIRKDYTIKELELRVDANGAFSPEVAMDKLMQLADFDIHSIEQPIRAGQWDSMTELCRTSPIPIALDEELIGVFDYKRKRSLLERIRPQYIILKPSLIGGFQGSKAWISLCDELGIGWWITSALESNIGLNAIAQFTYTLENPMPQGLGTGGLFSNNIASPLCMSKGALYLDQQLKWADVSGFLSE